VEPNRAMPIPTRFRKRQLAWQLGILLAALCSSANCAQPVRAAAPTDDQANLALPQWLQPGDPHAHGLAGTDLESLRGLLRKGINDRTVPGVSLLLAHRGEVIFKEALGNLSVDQKVMMASSSKPVTATLLLILADQKKLSLDDPIEKYLPEFRPISLKETPPVKPPTIRHLLCNMSGLPGDF